MLVNPKRGEVSVVVDGQERRLRLTLGALAALEERLGSRSLVGMIEGFEQGDIRAGDILLILWAGLNGGGWDVSVDDVRRADFDGGPIVAAKRAGRLLALTFAGDDDE